MRNGRNLTLPENGANGVRQSWHGRFLRVPGCSEDRAAARRSCRCWMQRSAAATSSPWQGNARWMATACRPVPTMASLSRKITSGRPTPPPMASRTARCCRWPSTSAPATCGRAPWAGSAASQVAALTLLAQLNSDLSNDVVYGVSVEGEDVWVATAASACRLDLHTGQWALYNERNTPMNKIWVYGVHATSTKVYFAVWGSGLLEYDQKTGKWDKYDDPDGENERVLFKDQGLIHEIVTSVSYVDNIVWAATYFGDSRYDGRYWHNFLTKEERASLKLHQSGEGFGRQSGLVRHG